MGTRYFVCTIGGFGEYSERLNLLKDWLAKRVYKVHRDARWPWPLGQVQKGDTLLLKLQSQVVAWGTAAGPVTTKQTEDGWDHIVEVDDWHRYDNEDPASGIHHYGIQLCTKPGAGQFAVVKEVEASWAEEKLAAFKPTRTPINDTQVTCCQESLKELFTRDLHIPGYQRCFCWRRGHITDLLETLRTQVYDGRIYDGRSQDQETHLGTLILKQDGGRLHIVDGQQRLLTLTILAYSMYKRRGEDGSLPLLHASLDGTSADSQSARRHLCWAKTTIDNWLARSKVTDPGPMLNQVRFCVVILPTKASEDLAYTFFNAVNSCGKRLSDFDLLKAHHLRFIADEAVARSMAKRWDDVGAEGYGQILHKVLYRLRSWSRRDKPAVDAEEGHNLFAHFSARASRIEGMFFPPLAIHFNSTIHGGAPFFHYAEQYRLSWEHFWETDACKSLVDHLSGHSGNVLRDCICALLFLFYCKFGRNYLDDALFCISEVVSVIRNETQVRATAIQKDILKECLFALDTALDPGQFFDWCLSIERQYGPDAVGQTKERYWGALWSLYGFLQKKERLVTVRRQCQLRLEQKQSRTGEGDNQ